MTQQSHLWKDIPQIHFNIRNEMCTRVFTRTLSVIVKGLEKIQIRINGD